MPATTEAGVFDESGLLAKAREGDVAAFSELVNRYSRKIYRLAKHITQNDTDAEDVLQETFMKSFEHLGDFQGQSKFYTWIVRIAVNESHNRRRWIFRRPTSDIPRRKQPSRCRPCYNGRRRKAGRN